jgi:hypothetical protein
MGDPLSPGMTILACAHRETKWLRGQSETVRKQLHAGRYMDDILLVARRTGEWDFEEEIRRMEEIYAPLKLEREDKGTFLETQWGVENNQMWYRLKNDNEKEMKVWRYQHFHSDSPFMIKRGTLAACLRKVQKYASDRRQLQMSAVAKLREFIRLRYPISVLWKACSFMGASTGSGEWISIRQGLRAICDG